MFKKQTNTVKCPIWPSGYLCSLWSCSKAMWACNFCVGYQRVQSTWVQQDTAKSLPMKCTVHGLFTSNIYRLLFEAIVMACVGVIIAWSVYHLHRWRSRLEAAAVTLSFFFFFFCCNLELAMACYHCVDTLLTATCLACHDLSYFCVASLSFMSIQTYAWGIRYCHLQLVVFLCSVFTIYTDTDP